MRSYLVSPERGAQHLQGLRGDWMEYDLRCDTSHLACERGYDGEQVKEDERRERLTEMRLDSFRFPMMHERA